MNQPSLLGLGQGSPFNQNSLLNMLGLGALSKQYQDISQKCKHLSCTICATEAAELSCRRKYQQQLAEDRKAAYQQRCQEYLARFRAGYRKRKSKTEVKWQHRAWTVRVKGGETDEKNK